MTKLQKKITVIIILIATIIVCGIVHVTNISNVNATSFVLDKDGVTNKKLNEKKVVKFDISNKEDIDKFNKDFDKLMKADDVRIEFNISGKYSLLGSAYILSLADVTEDKVKTLNYIQILMNTEHEKTENEKYFNELAKKVGYTDKEIEKSNKLAYTYSINLLEKGSQK